MRSIWIPLLFLACVAKANPHREALSDASARKREAAALALAKAGAAEAVPELVELLRDDVSSVRLAAIVALGRSGGPRAIAPLRRLLLDKPKFDGPLVRALVELGDGEGVGQFLARRRKDAYSLDAKWFRLCLDDPSWQVRRWALLHPGLRKEWPDSWTARVGELALDDPAHAVRYAAQRHVLRRRAHYAPLIRRMASSVDPRTRRMAARGLRASDDLLRLCGDPDGLVRAWALFGLRDSDAVLPDLRKDRHAVAQDTWMVVEAKRGRLSARVVGLSTSHQIDPPFSTADWMPRRNLRGGGGTDGTTPPLARLSYNALLAHPKKSAPLVARVLETARPADRLDLIYLLGHLGEPALPFLDEWSSRSAAAVLCRTAIAVNDSALDSLIAILVDDRPKSTAEQRTIARMALTAHTPRALRRIAARKQPNNTRLAALRRELERES